jgi:hypothetical protein
MKNIARLPKEERLILFRNTAANCGLSEGIVEKDFWVCWTLDYLFHQSPWANHLAFKGGTSLSKSFDLIHRFSEDIDLILDWRLLESAQKDPWAQRSKNQQDKLNKALNAETEVFLREQFVPKLREDFAQLLVDEFQIEVDEHETQTVNFTYPKLFGEASILPMVCLEIGALAAWTPTTQSEIISYAAQQYGRIFQNPSTSVLTVMPERTFWEKVTILHKEAFRTNGNFPARYSRHYYDLFCMDASPVKAAAFGNLDLLARVVTFKDRFYPAGNAHYDLAKPGTMRLLPPEDCLPVLRDDYAHMRNMLFGEIPSFEEIMACIARLEKEINSL